MSEQDQLHRAVADIYEAAINPGHWAGTVDRIRQALGGVGGVVFLTDQDQQITSWHSVGIEPDGSEYGRRIHAINPRAHWSLAMPGAVCWDYRFTDERTMDRHEFYDWIRREGDVRYFIGAYYPLDDGMHLFASVERNHKQGHVDETDIAHFGLLAPHIRNAVALSGQLAEVKERAGLYDLLDQNGAKGLILLAATGEVVDTNAEADRILTENDGLAITDGYLKTSKAADTRHLYNLVADAVAAALGGGGVMSLTRPSGALSYMLRVMPWPIHLDGTRETIAAAMLVADPSHRAYQSVHTDLQAALGLSVREAELAVHLSHGKSLSEAAAAMEIRTNTARVHLTHIFEKTGVSNQGDLLRILLSIP